MGMLQVKNLPDDLHAALAERARGEGVTMSAYVTRLLKIDLHRPTMREWLLEQRATETGVRSIDVLSAVDNSREDYDRVDS